MTKTQERLEAVRADARKHLSELKPGDTVYTIIRDVSRSGMSRRIDLLTFEEYGPNWLTYWTAALFDGKIPTRAHADNGRGIVRHGCGMDMALDTVETLSYYLFGKTGQLKHRSL